MSMKGEIYALLAAFTWGCALVLFKRSGEQMGPLLLNLFKNLFALILLVITLLVFDSPLQPFKQLTQQEHMMLFWSGVLGLAVADSFLFASLNRVGVTRMTVIDCLYSPSIIACSWFLLGETIGWAHIVGAALIMLGIAVTAERHPTSKKEEKGTEHDSKELWLGILYGVLAIVIMAYAIVVIKPILQKVPLVWATTYRLFAGSIALLLWLLLTQRSQLTQLLRPQPSWRYSIPAAFLGTYLAMLFWVGGFKYAKASVAGLINQSSIVFAILLSVVFLKERLTPRKITAVLLATLGVLFVTFFAKT